MFLIDFWVLIDLSTGAFTGSHLNEDNTKAIRRRPVALSADHQGTNRFGLRKRFFDIFFFFKKKNCSAESRRRHHGHFFQKHSLHLIFLICRSIRLYTIAQRNAGTSEIKVFFFSRNRPPIFITLISLSFSLGHAISESSDGGDLSPLDGDIELQAPSPSFSDRSDHSVVSVHASQHGKHTKKRKKKHSASQEAE